MSNNGGLRGWWQMRRALAAGRRAAADDAEPALVAIFHTEAEARLAAGALRDAGIPANVLLDQPEGFSGGLTEAARVFVPRSHREQAKSLLADIDQSG
ncbi:MAG TPA: hypothetical protein VFH66_11460 [Mycobacteriales bacterium]|nr:hypothetical protein [Mycobacteriales bacterium]